MKKCREWNMCCYFVSLKLFKKTWKDKQTWSWFRLGEYVFVTLIGFSLKRTFPLLFLSKTLKRFSICVVWLLSLLPIYRQLVDRCRSYLYNKREQHMRAHQKKWTKTINYYIRNWNMLMFGLCMYSTWWKAKQRIKEKNCLL